MVGDELTLNRLAKYQKRRVGHHDALIKKLEDLVTMSGENPDQDDDCLID